MALLLTSMLYVPGPVSVDSMPATGSSSIMQGGQTLALGLALSGCDVTALWVNYIALGGRHSLPHLRLYVTNQTAWADIEHDIAAQALNEYCATLGLGHPVSYANDPLSR